MARYEAPALTELGSLSALTLQNNKIGATPDIFTAITGGAVVGDITPIS